MFSFGQKHSQDLLSLSLEKTFTGSKIYFYGVKLSTFHLCTYSNVTIETGYYTIIIVICTYQHDLNKKKTKTIDEAQMNNGDRRCMHLHTSIDNWLTLDTESDGNEL